MAKKPSRSGGRVTPKGTRPADAPKARTAAGPSDVERKLVTRIDPSASRRAFGPAGPTRAGHHRGQR